MDMQDQMTYSDLMSAYLDKLSDQWRDWRKRRLLIAYERGIEVSQRIIDNELDNKAYFQTQHMLVTRELNDKGKS